MIRELKKEDIDQVMEIWLNENIKAHDFIDADCWKQHFDEVKQQIKQAEVYVYEKDEIQAFIGLIDNYIAGIFVDALYQGKGIGNKLISYAKAKKKQLVLQVYKKNEKAVQFYVKQGFKMVQEQIDEDTNEIEYTLVWK